MATLRPETAARRTSSANQADDYEFLTFQPGPPALSYLSLDQSQATTSSFQNISDDVHLLKRSDGHDSTDIELGALQSLRTNTGRIGDTGSRSTSASAPTRAIQAVHQWILTSLMVLRDHNPSKERGRENIRNFVLKSGPAYQTPGKNTTQSVPKSSFEGWRMGALLNLGLLSACLISEIVMLVVALVVDTGSDNSSANGLLFSGSCEVAGRLTIPIALFINIIATLTLGSSNYMMQCLSAPTGIELRKAHDNGKFLRVGVSSPLNVDYVSRAKMAMWWMMGFTSVPVHLLFNSAFYGTLQANNYAIAVLTSDFQNMTLWNGCSSGVGNSWTELICDLNKEVNYQPAEYENISVTDCIERYSAPLLSQYSNVVLVSTLTSDQRNQTLEHLWSSERPLNMSNLGFSACHDPSGATQEECTSEFDSSLLQLDAVLGIFTAYEYESWRNSYRSGINWFLDGSTLEQTVANATLSNGTTITGSQLQNSIANGSLKDVDLLATITLPTGIKLFDVSISNKTVAGETFLNGTAPVDTASYFDPTLWLCNDNVTSQCTVKTALQESADWRVTPYGIPISYCMSKKTPVEKCELRYSSFVLGVVIACDICKIIIVIFALRPSVRPLLTTGDVIAYFMQHREPLTERRCLLTQQQAKSDERDFLAMIAPSLEPCWSESCFPIDLSTEESQPLLEPTQIKDRALQKFFLNVPPVSWQASKQRWHNVVSRDGWLYLYAIMLCAAASIATLFIEAALDIKSTGSGNMWTRGLSAPDRNAVFTSTAQTGGVSQATFLGQIILVNSPQMFFTMVYFAYNGTFTIMHAAEEWSGFAKERKALRVSDPQPGQRSSYWLNLPWAYSLPLLVVSSLLHWMVSRSLYLVNIGVYGPSQNYVPSQTIFACGFSTVFLLLVLGLLLIMAAVIAGFSFRSLRGDVPLIGANSLAISAVCHGPNTADDEVCKPLLWGVTRRPVDGQPGHCSLSSGEVEKPIPGQEYL